MDVVEEAGQKLEEQAKLPEARQHSDLGVEVER